MDTPREVISEHVHENLGIIRKAGIPVKVNGVDKSTYEEYLKRKITREEFASMDSDQAIEALHFTIVKKNNIDELPPYFASLVTGVLLSIPQPKAVLKLLQLALMESGYGPVDIDGVVGPETINILKEADQETIEQKFCFLVKDYLKFLREKKGFDNITLVGVCGE